MQAQKAKSSSKSQQQPLNMTAQQAVELNTYVLCNLLGWLIILTAYHGRLFSSVNVLLINVCLLLLILTLSAGWKSHRLSAIPSAVGTRLCSELRMLEMGFPMAAKSCSRAPGNAAAPPSRNHSRGAAPCAGACPVSVRLWVWLVWTN